MSELVRELAARGRTWAGLLRGGVAEALAYRAQVLIWLLSSLFPLITLAVWLSVARQGDEPPGWDRADFVTYYATAAVVFQLTDTWLVWTWDADMRSGALSSRLLRPVPVVSQVLAQQLGVKVLVAGVMLPALALAAVLVGDVRYPASPVTAVLAVLATLLGVALSFGTAFLFALVSFWSTQGGNLYGLWWGGGAFLSGWVAPVGLLPEPLRTAAVYLPFRSTLGFPVELAAGRLDAAATALGFAVAAAWLLVVVVAFRLVWRRAVRRYQAVGG